ncbi:peroxisomal biogenesis factor 19 isoform X2 [Vanacampus margaritifer]
MASGPGESQSGHDAELDELLDSALDDFDKQSVLPESKAPFSSSSHEAETQPPLLEDRKLFETLFEGDMAAQAQQEWEKAMTELAQEEPDLLQHFQKLSEAAGKVGTDTASQQEFTSCLKDTLRGLAKNADNLQSSGLAGDDLVKALEGLGLDEGGEGVSGGGDDANILPVMQSIMQNLLSKEVLYPSLKEITTKYPEWLEANRASLSSEDVQRYEQQAKIMGEICQRFETDEDGDKVFEGIMELMQKLQDLGQPPKELAGDAPPGFNLDMDSLHLPGGLAGAGAADQCAIM